MLREFEQSAEKNGDAVISCGSLPTSLPDSAGTYKTSLIAMTLSPSALQPFRTSGACLRATLTASEGVSARRTAFARSGRCGNLSDWKRCSAVG